MTQHRSDLIGRALVVQSHLPRSRVLVQLKEKAGLKVYHPGPGRFVIVSVCIACSKVWADKSWRTDLTVRIQATDGGPYCI